MAEPLPSQKPTWSQYVRSIFKPTGLLKFLGTGWPLDRSVSTAVRMNSADCVDRPIRPLPKRRLKARLSDEQADSIVYPPAPSTASQAIGSQDQNQRAVDVNSKIYANATSVTAPDMTRAPRAALQEAEHSEVDSDDDREEGSISRQRSTWSNAAISQSRNAAHYSTASSGDGYESFENTNNKKKRKIPQHQHGLPSQALGDQPSNISNGPGAFQMDGAGQAEYQDESFRRPPDVPAAAVSRRALDERAPVRTSKERQPLGTATNVVNAPSRSASAQATAGADQITARSLQALPTTSTRKTNAQRPSTRPQKQENQSYDFTFERQSQSSHRLSQIPRPVTNRQPAKYVGGIRDSAPLATQPGSTAMPNGQSAPVQPTQQQQPQARAPAAQAPPAEQPPPPSRTEQYRIAAQDRRRSQRATNSRQLREKNDVTLCEFCEFKAIWLYTPRFLIRRYEERDLKRRQDIENRRRLLEKAKAKSRKTKKGAKGQRAAASAQQPLDPDQPPYDPAYDDGIAPEDAQSPGEDYFDDEFDDHGVHPDDYGDNAYDNHPPPLEPIMHGTAARGHTHAGQLQQRTH